MAKKDNLTQDLVRLQAEALIRHSNSTYGKFVLQTNDIQYYLKSLILLRSLFPGITKEFTEEIKEYLDRLELGQLIGHFRICIKNNIEMSIFKHLTRYNKDRNKLAHKMWSRKKLTLEDCSSAIDLGENIILFLEYILNPPRIQ